MKHKYLLGAVFVCAVHSASAQSILENKNEEELSLMLQEVVVTRKNKNSFAYNYSIGVTSLLILKAKCSSNGSW